MIFVDVIGRTIFSTPFPGAIEIIKNSVVSITFLQIPLAIYSDRMLHTTLLYGAVGAGLQKLMRSMVGLLGCVFRSEEHTSELQSLMRISYAVFCLKKKNTINIRMNRQNH